MEYGRIMWGMTSHNSATVCLIINQWIILRHVSCRVLLLVLSIRYIREGKGKFNDKSRVLLIKSRLLIRSVSVSQLDLVALPSKTPYISPYLSANIVIGTFLHKTDRKFKFSDSTYPRKHSFSSTWGTSTRAHKRKLVMVGATYSHRRTRKIISL